MAESERSAMTIAPLVVVVVLLAASMFMPWYEFEHSSGQRRADADPDAPANETGLAKDRILFLPFRVEGDADDDFRNATRTDVMVLWGLAGGALAAATFALAIEATVGGRAWTRRAGVATETVVALLALAAMAWVWIAFPDALSDRGVDRFFTSKRLDGEGFIRTTPLWGWIAAGVAVIASLTAIAVKYAGGPIDLSEIEEIGRRRQDPTRAVDRARPPR